MISCSQLYPYDFPVVSPSGAPFVLKEIIQAVVFSVCHVKQVFQYKLKKGICEYAVRICICI